MPTTIFGLPVHPLLVHATVVFVPLAVVLVIGAVLVPRFRAWAGPLPAAVSLVALILTPLSTASGENLERELPHNALIERHAQLGDQLLFFTIALFVFAAGFWWLTRRGTESGRWPRWLVTVVGALAIVTAVATGVQVARIGHSGAEAAWSDVGS
ncbi:DUF2231 domain-containing protein [Nocardioides sp. CN2-186]|uniref:DUF2231 domain-containing protein n=1 Tax=Nocardioides tweenelious TaxID=3156607 RepID=UPI0032B55147